MPTHRQFLGRAAWLAALFTFLNWNHRQRLAQGGELPKKPRACLAPLMSCRQNPQMHPTCHSRFSLCTVQIPGIAHRLSPRWQTPLLAEPSCWPKTWLPVKDVKPCQARRGWIWALVWCLLVPALGP